MEIPHQLKHSKKARKKREYLFEFLIIFVAKTGSSFAENLREHFVDRHKEKEYMVSNYDLKYALNYNAFNPINRTITQLMNTGGLGLVKEKAVSDGIVGYDNAKNSILKQADLLETRFTKIIDQQTEIFDFLSIMKSRNGSSILNLKMEFPIRLHGPKT